MLKAKTCSIRIEDLSGSVVEVSCGYLYHILCQRNFWLFYYMNLAAYQAQKIKFMDEVLRRVDEENRSCVAIISADNRVRTLVKSDKFAKPLMPMCAACRSPTISEGRKIRKIFVNQHAAKENNAKPSEEERKKQGHRYKETVNFRGKSVCEANKWTVEILIWPNFQSY